MYRNKSRYILYSCYPWTLLSCPLSSTLECSTAITPLSNVYKTQRKTYGPPCCDAIEYSDKDWDGCQDSRKSTSGYVILWKNAQIKWNSKCQTAVAGSTWETVYIATFRAARHFNTGLQLLIDLYSPQSSPRTWLIDNLGAVHVTKLPTQVRKKLDFPHRYLQETVHSKNISVKHIPSADNRTILKDFRTLVYSGRYQTESWRHFRGTSGANNPRIIYRLRQLDFDVNRSGANILRILGAWPTISANVLTEPDTGSF